MPKSRLFSHSPDSVCLFHRGREEHHKVRRKAPQIVYLQSSSDWRLLKHYTICKMDYRACTMFQRYRAIFLRRQLFSADHVGGEGVAHPAQEHHRGRPHRPQAQQVLH